MLIRLAIIEDALAITAARQAGWKASYRGIVPDAVLDGLDPDKETLRWQERFSQPPAADRSLVVAELEGQVVGFCGFGACRDEDPEYDGELYAIYIHPRAQRRGVGRALAQAARDWLKERGYRRMLIWVLRDNAPARRFYEALGGAVARERAIEIGGAMLPEVGYGYELDERE